MPEGSFEWPPEGSPLAVTAEMEAMMKKMSYPIAKVSPPRVEGVMRGAPSRADDRVRRLRCSNAT